MCEQCRIVVGVVRVKVRGVGVVRVGVVVVVVVVVVVGGGGGVLTLCMSVTGDDESGV